MAQAYENGHYAIVILPRHFSCRQIPVDDRHEIPDPPVAVAQVFENLLAATAQFLVEGF